MTERLRAGEIEIAYETFGAPGDPPLLLIMGLGMQMLAWRDDLCGLLADQGFRAIRFDNRDVGLSTHLDDAPEPDLPELIAGDHSSAPYQIEDMAEDALGLLNGLGIERAHVVGASMGGYIAQALAIRRPDRVLSLTSIMSTPSVEVGRATRDAQVVLLASDRTDALRGLRVPTLVIHGEADPLVQLEGGKATAAAIPGARLLTFPGMGHDLPRALWPPIVAAIADLARDAGASVAPANRGQAPPGSTGSPAAAPGAGTRRRPAR